MFYYTRALRDDDKITCLPFLLEARLMKQKFKKVLKPDTEFSKRIRKRHKIFWKKESEIPLFFAEDPIEKWKDRENWQRILSNKHNSREFAKKFNCRVPKLYWKGRNLEQLHLENLPLQFVIRPSMGFCSNNVFLMKNSHNLFDGRTYTNEELIYSLQRVINQYPTTEFLFEEFLTNEQGDYKIPDDYKFYTFNGEIACVRVINRLSPVKGSNMYYNEDWVPLQNLKKTKYTAGTYQPPPDCYEEMKSQVKILSKAYGNFVRIDFYATKKGPVFGEFASTPSRGNGYSAHGSKFLIEKWDRYCKGMI